MIPCTPLDRMPPDLRYLGDIEGLGVWANAVGTRVVFRGPSGALYGLTLDPATDYGDLTELLAIFLRSPCGKRL
ncbi:hypothetical protein SAMN00768000_0230 [Sulfobacillus thermosulfidooxidans DSM 9293]|uniref:Uncharacterized protein n=1 Tax=Sulfobacillus thermosulfidooxidans (strain DSM 9293 / VKM B-1269 / AT-1) TaxID=929705 RepID=A0A1W1W6U3_SULTA|nr:hypothetical protein [Sulfobacillus thermosulfidooxidans]SMC02021.1 hypothetical protein SAMN00768000_0230 [Sulfobacillus thermosulfidooxidans DSM 9293]